MNNDDQSILREKIRVTEMGRDPRYFKFPEEGGTEEYPVDVATTNQLNEFKSFFAAPSLLNSIIGNNTGFSFQQGKIAGGVTLSELAAHTITNIVNTIGDNAVTNLELRSIEFGLTYYPNATTPEDKVAKIDVLLNTVSQGVYNYNTDWVPAESEGDQSGYPKDLLSTLNMLIEYAGIFDKITDLQKTRVRIQIPLTELSSGENKVALQMININANGDDESPISSAELLMFKETLDKPNIAGKLVFAIGGVPNTFVRSGINQIGRGGNVYLSSNGFIDNVFNQTYQDNILYFSSAITGNVEEVATGVVFTGTGNAASPDKDDQISFANKTFNVPNDIGINSSIPISMTVRTPRGNSIETINELIVAETHDLSANGGLAESTESMETFQTEVRRYPTNANSVDNDAGWRDVSKAVIDSSTYTYQSHDLLWIGSQCIYGKLNFANATPSSALDRSAITGMAYFVRGFEVANASNLRLTFGMAQDFTGMAIQLLYADADNEPNSSAWVDCLTLYDAGEGNIPRSALPSADFGIATSINSSTKVIDVTLTNIITAAADKIFIRVGYPDTNQKVINSLNVEAI